mmetsp:Transcript_83237/g.131000  ORF Transcript_83237/g.131000 Transcript_83237/m.131000 type:complete len:237 (+) Transcript_83237:71-781(+)
MGLLSFIADSRQKNRLDQQSEPSRIECLKPEQSDVLYAPRVRSERGSNHAEIEGLPISCKRLHNAMDDVTASAGSLAAPSVRFDSGPVASAVECIQQEKCNSGVSLDSQLGSTTSTDVRVELDKSKPIVASRADLNFRRSAGGKKKVEKSELPRVFSCFLETPPRTQRKKRLLQHGLESEAKQSRRCGLLKRPGFAWNSLTPASLGRSRAILASIPDADLLQLAKQTEMRFAGESE